MMCTQRLLHLPDEVLLRVLHALIAHDGTHNSQNFRDVWNLATTCRKLYALTKNSSNATSATTRMLLENNALGDVVSTMPDDVVQGALLTLRSHQTSLSTLRTVRLGVLQRDQLQAVLTLLQRCCALKELWFVDVPGGVTVPKEVARRLDSLSIVLPHQHTMSTLDDAAFLPRRLQMLRVSGDAAQMLYRMWTQWMRACTRADVVWAGEGGSKRFPYAWHLPPEDIFRVPMQIGHSERLFDARCMLHLIHESTTEMERDDSFFRKTTLIRDWLKYALKSPYGLLPMTPMRRGRILRPVLTVVLDCVSTANTLMSDGGKWISLFATNVVCYEYQGRIDTLLVALSPHCSAKDARAAATAAALVAAAVKEVRVLATSATVFGALKHVSLPRQVRSVAVLDQYVTNAFLSAVPTTMAALSKSAVDIGLHSVWMENMTLRDHRDDDNARQREALLRNAEAACRRAETCGLCAAGMRGVFERWIREL
ncbi:hypothetical protein FGB62_99g019 [Gracilaria domingensis]|nr:hypothetical protein FGB62_99g019 [Gracilaria domingensis]